MNIIKRITKKRYKICSFKDGSYLGYKVYRIRMLKNEYIGEFATEQRAFEYIETLKKDE